jgi:hypothetical protein
MAGKPWKNFACQTGPLAIKCKYPHCSLSMRVFDFVEAIFTDTRKMGSLTAAQRRRPNSTRSPIPEKRGHGPMVRGSEPAGLEGKWKSCFADSIESSEEPNRKLMTVPRKQVMNEFDQNWNDKTGELAESSSREMTTGRSADSLVRVFQRT